MNADNAGTMQAVRFDDYGSTCVLEVRNVPIPSCGPSQVRVAVAYAGINPGEIIIREGHPMARKMFPARFPDEGQGSDFTGVVTELGQSVTQWSVGQLVIGMSDERSSQAEFVTIDESRLVALPEGLDPKVAGCLYVSGTTACAIVNAAGVSEKDTVVISAAAGGVGILASQLARRAGARVIGIASSSSAEVLSGLGVEPLAYGDDLVERIRAVAPDGVDAFLDCFGNGYVDAAVSLGVPQHRINTIIDYEAAQRHGTLMVGMAAIKDPAAVVAKLAELIARQELVFPIRAVYPMTEVRAAYDDLAGRHGVGKIVLAVNP